MQVIRQVTLYRLLSNGSKMSYLLSAFRISTVVLALLSCNNHLVVYFFDKIVPSMVLSQKERQLDSLWAYNVPKKVT